ncbi:hypothetical protein D3C86_1447110 [compost metagenome]
MKTVRRERLGLSPLILCLGVLLGTSCRAPVGPVAPRPVPLQPGWSFKPPRSLPATRAATPSATPTPREGWEGFEWN